MKLAIVTATTDAERALDCVQSWRRHAAEITIIGVVNGPLYSKLIPDFDEAICVPEYLGSVPAFQRGVQLLLDQPATDRPDVIACLHDDFRIDEPRWDEKVLKHIDRHPGCGLLGFGGAWGLGDTDIYQKPYNPMQLARIGFRSNLTDAEIHGMRSLLPERVACLDGFSQIGRYVFWDGYRNMRTSYTRYTPEDRPWDVLASLGFVHHFYDGALGCLAKRYGWETWYLPLRGHHFGGRTAVGDQGYGEWAKTRDPEGDRGFWEAAHRAGYEAFRGELPLRV